MPSRWQRLAINDKGYPVPFFVGYVDGKADFRVVDRAKLIRCVRFSCCWLCGEKLGRVKTYVIGPMCAVNRTTAEPGSHRECAEYAVVTCPFLTLPNAKRREANMPANTSEPAGYMIERNPGVTLLWHTNRLTRFPDGNGGVLFRLGDPLGCEFYAEEYA